VDWKASLDWTIFDESGIMPAASYTAAELVVVDLTLSAGAWSASSGDAYIKYTMELATIGLYASTSYDIYGFGTNIGAAQGVTLATDLAPLSLDAVYTTDKEYGVGGKYTADQLTVGAKYNSTGAYGVELVSPVGDITLTGQYVAGGTMELGYLVKAKYALTAGTVSVEYKSTKAPTAAATTTISAALASYPITDTTTLGASVASTAAVTTISGSTSTALAEGVTLKLNVASTGGTLTYSGVIGVSL
jgi:hypothetical protein